MKANVYEYWKGLPPWAKGAIGVGAALVAYFVGKSIWDAVKEARDAKVKLKESSDAVTVLNKLAAQGIYPTHTDAEFEGWSNQLATAFGGCGTDMGAIGTIFTQLNNQADLYKLIATYGIRPYEGCSLLFEGQQSVSLSAAMVAELDNTERQDINTILAVKNINYSY